MLVITATPQDRAPAECPPLQQGGGAQKRQPHQVPLPTIFRESLQGAPHRTRVLCQAFQLPERGCRDEEGHRGQPRRGGVLRQAPGAVHSGGLPDLR